MGAITDQPAQPYVPPAPKPGVPPSGIAGNPGIREQANRAKTAVSNRQQQFLAMMRDSAPQSETGSAKYASAAAALHVSHDAVNKFIDRILFG